MTSSVFTVQVMAKPLIVSQPVDVNATLGGNFTLTAGAESNGTATPLTYQWYRNGVAIKGATGSTYSASGLHNDSPAIGSVAGTEKFFQGSLDDLRVYNRNLSASEIALLAQGKLPERQPAPGIVPILSRGYSPGQKVWTFTNDANASVTSENLRSRP